MQAWVRADALSPGDIVIKPLEPWETDTSWDAGWLAGFLDGEGTLAQNQAKGHRPSFRLSGYQRPGATADRMLAQMGKFVPFKKFIVERSESHNWNSMVMARVDRLPHIMQLLGAVRPPRLLELGEALWEGAALSSKIKGGSDATVTSVISCGDGNIAKLATSTKTYIANGFAVHNTQPVVTIWDEDVGKYVLVDGFHRYYVCKTNADVLERNNGMLPIVVIEKDINDRMASTVRHNRARGKHSIEGMANMVFCLSPDTRLLTSDLRWVPIADIKVGDELIACDEQLSQKNKMRRSRVIGRKDQVADRVRITTTEGVLVCTNNHQWVSIASGKTARKWRRADQLRPGMRLVQFCQPWSSFDTYEDGWVSGVLDGEGYVHKSTNIVGVAQNEGFVLDRLRKALLSKGFTLNEHLKGECVELRVREMLKLIGAYRPSRLLPKAVSLWEGKRSWSKHTLRPEILAIEALTPGYVCGIATETGTVTAEGFLTHNTMLDEGWTDDEICNELGMEPGELLRLKHITGFSKLFEDVNYQNAWKSRTMIRAEKAEREKQNG